VSAAGFSRADRKAPKYRGYEIGGVAFRLVWY